MRAHRIYKIGLAVLGLSVWAGCTPQPLAVSTLTPTVQVTDVQPEITASAALDTLVVGDISDDPSGTLETHQPLADYVAAQLSSPNIIMGEVRVAPDIETMAAWLRDGEVDLYFDSPYPALIVSQEAGGQIILRRWKDGVEQYHSVFFALAESNFTAIEDLAGHVVAFDGPYSTSGYMLPLSYLVEAGLNADEKATPDGEVADDEVGYMFSLDDDTSIQWVISGRVSAAVVDDVTYSEIPQATRDRLMVIAETEALPRHVAVVSPTMDASRVEALSTVLVQMNTSEEGRIVLENFEQTARFDEFPDGADTALDRMRALYSLVQNR